MIRSDVNNDLPGAVEEAYVHLHDQLLGLATLLCGSRSMAEEVVQDVFASAIPRWHTIEQPEHYLKRSVVNRARTVGKRNSRLRVLPLPREIVIGEPKIDEAWRLLRRLPSRQRMVLVLRFYLDLPDREIAEIMQCAEPTLRSLALRALTTLRKELI